THKLWLSTNHRPVIREVTHAMWRRVLLFVWAVEIPVEAQDLALKDRLPRGPPGVPARLVAACLAWQARGIDPPPAVLLATAAYRDESDPLGEWLAACSTREPLPGKATARLMAREALRSYLEWAAANGCEPLTATALGTA